MHSSSSLEATAATVDYRDTLAHVSVTFVFTVLPSHHSFVKRSLSNFIHFFFFSLFINVANISTVVSVRDLSRVSESLVSHVDQLFVFRFLFFSRHFFNF